MDLKSKKIICGSLVLLGTSGLMSPIKSTERADFSIPDNPPILKIQSHISAASKQTSPDTWGDWFIDLLEPFKKTAGARTLEQAVNDPEFWKIMIYNNFMENIELYENGGMTRHELELTLKHARTQVIEGRIDAEDYFEALKGLKDVSLKKENQKFFKLIKQDHKLLSKVFINELLNLVLNPLRTQGRNFKQTLNFYKIHQSPLDHLNTISQFGRVIQENSEGLKISAEQKDKMSDIIKKYLADLKNKPKFSGAFNQEIKQIVEDRVKEQDEKASLESLEANKSVTGVLKGIAYEGGKLVYEASKFAVENPGVTIGGLVLASAGAAAAVQTFTFPATTGSNLAVGGFQNDPQNRFLTAWDDGTNINGQVFYPNGTASGTSEVLIPNAAYPVISNYPNGSIALGAAPNTGTNTVQSVSLNGNSLSIGTPAPLIQSQGGGNIGNLKLTPLSGQNSTIPADTLFCAWNRGGNGYASLLYPNGTATPDQLFGLVESAISQGSNANLVVFLDGSSNTIDSGQVGYNMGSFSHWGGASDLCKTSSNNGATYGLTAQTPSGNILMLCDNTAGTSTQSLSSAGLPLSNAQNATAQTLVSPFAIVELPNGNGILYGNDTLGNVRFTPDAGITWGAEVQVTNGTLNSATSLPNGDIVAIKIGTGYIVSPNEYNPSSSTSSSTTSGSTTSTTSGGTTSGGSTTTTTRSTTIGNSGTTTSASSSTAPATSSSSTLSPSWLTSAMATTSASTTTGSPSSTSNSGTITSTGSTTAPAASSSSFLSPSWLNFGIVAGIGYINNWWNQQRD